MSLPEQLYNTDNIDLDLDEVHFPGGYQSRLEDCPARDGPSQPNIVFRDGTAARFTNRNGETMALVQKSIRMRKRKPGDDLIKVAKGQSFDSHGSSNPTHVPLSQMEASHDQYMDLDHEDSHSLNPLGDSFDYLAPPSTDCDMAIKGTCAHVDASPHSDMYGWEAELNRRQNLSASTAETSRDGEMAMFRFQRADGSMTSLIRRVLRTGSSSSLGRYESN